MKVVLPFPIPKCPEYTGPDPKPLRNVGNLDNDDEWNEDGTYRGDADDDFEECADFMKPTGAAEKRLAQQDALERALSYEQLQLQTWNGVVQRPDKSTLLGMVPIVISRRFDFRYRAPEGFERRIDTVLPSHSVEFRNLERLQ